MTWCQCQKKCQKNFHILAWKVLQAGENYNEPGPSPVTDESLEEANNNSIFFTFLPPLNMVIYQGNEQPQAEKSPKASQDWIYELYLVFPCLSSHNKASGEMFWRVVQAQAHPPFQTNN